MLWFVVTAREPAREVVAVRFAPQLDSGLVLRDAPPPIRALVVGTPSELLKLYSASPVIRRPVAADAPDTLVLDLSPRDVVLPAGVDAIVQDVQPRTLTLRFESTSRRRVPVQSALRVATGGWPGQVIVRFDPESVEVRGPRRALGRLASVSTVRQTLAAQDSLPYLVDLDTTGLGEVQLSPPQVKVHVRFLPIREPLGTRRPDTSAAQPPAEVPGSPTPPPVPPDSADVPPPAQEP